MGTPASDTDGDGHFLAFLDAPGRSAKPRDTGTTMVATSTGIPGPVLERYADYVDLMKVLDSAMWADRRFVEADVRAAIEHDVEVQIGGVPHEIARLQGEEGAFLEEMAALGVEWIEYETHVDDPTPAEMEAAVGRLRDRGFRVVGEVGAKWFWTDETRPSKAAVDVEETVRRVEAFIDAGCEKVYWEGLVLRNLLGRHLENEAGQAAILEVADRVGTDDLVFELWGPSLTHLEHATYWSWFVHHFGPEVNLANVPPTMVPLLESVRRGTLYEMDHPYLRWLKEGAPTERWWEMPAPPYDVGLEPGWAE